MKFVEDDSKRWGEETVAGGSCAFFCWGGDIQLLGPSKMRLLSDTRSVNLAC